jgi:hypothetical protein
MSEQASGTTCCQANYLKKFPALWPIWRRRDKVLNHKGFAVFQPERGCGIGFWGGRIH